MLRWASICCYGSYRTNSPSSTCSDTDPALLRWGTSVPITQHKAIKKRKRLDLHMYKSNKVNNVQGNSSNTQRHAKLVTSNGEIRCNDRKTKISTRHGRQEFENQGGNVIYEIRQGMDRVFASFNW